MAVMVWEPAGKPAYGQLATPPVTVCDAQVVIAAPLSLNETVPTESGMVAPPGRLTVAVNVTLLFSALVPVPERVRDVVVLALMTSTLACGGVEAEAR